MKRALGHAGYTIMETMIFLVISASLFATAAILFNGRIERTEFTQSVQQLNAEIQNTISEVSSGTYTSPDNFGCTAVANTPQVTPGGATTQQGTRSDCVFLGKIMHFAVDDPSTCTATSGVITSGSVCNKVNTYAVVGLRTNSLGQTLTNLAQNSPRVINNVPTSYNTLPTDLSKYYTTAYQLHVTGMQTNATSSLPAVRISAFGLFLNNSQSTYNSDNSLSSGAANVDVVPVDGSAATLSDSQIDNLVADPTSPFTTVNPSGGISICLASGNQTATIVIGSNHGSLTSTITIGNTTCV